MSNELEESLKGQGFKTVETAGGRAIDVAFYMLENIKNQSKDTEEIFYVQRIENQYKMIKYSKK